MKNFKQFLSESITINGDFNGTLNVGGSEPETSIRVLLCRCSVGR